MNFRNILTGTIISLALLTSCAQEKSVDLVPQPQQVVLEKGNFTFDNNVSIVGNSQFEMDFLKGKLSASAGIALKDGQNGGKTIEINVDPSAATKKEGYILNVTPDKITISASDKAGAFYGVQTLLQLMPEGIYSKENYGIYYRYN